MTRPTAIPSLVLALLLGALLPVAAVAAEAPLPTSMAAVGDSITQAASTGGTLGADAPQNSWSTGSSSTVTSHYLRLIGAGADIDGRNYNLSVSGARVGGLQAQMQNAVSVAPDYLTVLIGGNDLCTDTVAEMTPVSVFHDQFQAAMATLDTGSPGTHVYVVSIPDVYQLWSLFRNNFFARFVWASADICQSLLANPASTQAADVQRRAAVRQRNIDYNAALAEVCAQFATCLFDGNAAFNTALTTSDVSGDYFHPSIAGQAKLASVSWAAGYTWTSGPPPNVAPTAAFSFSCAALTCSFTDESSDDGTIAARAWQFGDGSTSSSTAPSHTYPAAGTYNVVLEVTDDDGATDDATAPVTVSEPDAMTVESLSESSVVTGRNTWTATVTIRVVDGAGVAVAGATASGTWTVGAGDTCTTGPDGRCSVTSDSLNRKKVASVTFKVTGVTHATLAYEASLTSITVQRPA